MASMANGSLGAKVVVGLAVVAPIAVFFGEAITGRTELAGAAAVVPVLLGTVVFWGMWPVLRRMSRLDTLRFCSGMILVQTVWVVVCVSMFFPDAVATALESMATTSGALSLLAGISLALGDCGIALTIEQIGIGVGPPIIFTTNIVFGSSIDYALSEDKSTCRGACLGFSVCVAVVGILLNSLASAAKPPPTSEAEKEGLLVDGVAGAPPAADRWRRTLELGACVTVGIFSGGWSPLLTAASDASSGNDGNYLWGFYVIFQVGECLALAALVALAALAHHALGGKARADGDGKPQALCGGNWKAALRVYGVAASTGIVIGTGFVCYFLTTSADVASSTSYALGSCCSLVSMAYSYFVFREYEHAPPSVVLPFKLAGACYAVAIFILALSEPVFCV